MRQRHRPSILSLFQLGITTFIFWQVYRAQAFDPGGNPMEGANAMFRSIGLIFMGVFAIAALNLLYPLLAWGVSRLRERQRSWDPPTRPVAAGAETPQPTATHCPTCGASLFDEAPACPWCGHPLR